MRLSFCLLIFVLLARVGWANSNDTSFLQKIYHQFWNQVQKYPQEKVYLHTDRDHYDVRDTVWFKAYLTNIYTNLPSNLSRFVYVELRDDQNGLHARVKVPIRNSVFSGYIALSDKLLQGDYILRAYSYWMQNDGDDYVFRKRIRVVNPYSALVQHKMNYEKSGDQYVVNIHFYNSRNESYDRTSIDLVQDGKVTQKRTDAEGKLQLPLDSLQFGKKILVRFHDPFSYEKSLYLPDPRKDFVASFMPEGGHLLEGCSQTVAIKAIGPDGLSREVSGYVMNDKGEQVAVVHTVHRGMGKFDLQVEPGQKYHAILSVKGGEQKRFDLPQAEPVGLGIKLIPEQDSIYFAVMATKNVPNLNNLYLFVHSKGIPYFCVPLNMNMAMSGKLPTKDLPEGIVNFVLMDECEQVYSERLCYVHAKKQSKLNLTSNKSIYNTRERVEMSLQVLADSLVSKKGSFSVAITDDDQVERDSLQNHIKSYLLLNSELKGYIEDPAFYFKGNYIQTRSLLDLLMMTQGWSRFRLPDFLKKGHDSFAYYMERGQVIAGRIKDFTSKDNSKMKLVLRNNKMGYQGLIGVEVDVAPDGSFIIDDIAFPDSTKFVLQLTKNNNKSGIRIYEMEVDKDTFMIPYVKIPYNANMLMAEDNFYKRFSKDYFYENGVKVYVLDEVFIKKESRRSTDLFYERNADYSLDSKQIAELSHLDITDIIRRIPGITIIRDTVYYMGDSIVLVVNDMIESFDYVQRLRVPEDIVSIQLVTPLASRTFLGERGNNGLINIITPINYVASPPRNRLAFSLLGYQQKAEFYMPQYDVDAVRKAMAYTSDLRSTIYWNPKIETDHEGKAKFEFYTSDSYGPYTVIVEGILENGTIYRKEAKIHVE